MALAREETFTYGEAVDPRNLTVGAAALAVEVYFDIDVPSTGPSLSFREISGTVTAVPDEESVAGFVHIQPLAETDHQSFPIHVLGIARGAAVLDRKFVESQVYFYSLATPQS